MWISGVIYLGASAGSHIATLNIEHVINFDNNITNTKDFKGLGLIDGIVICHYDESRKKLFEQLNLDKQYKVYSLKDEQIMFYNGKDINII